MVIYGHCHNLFSLFLSDHIGIQLFLNHMRRRYILHGKLRLRLLTLFKLLLFGDLSLWRHLGQIIKVQIHIGHIGNLRKIHPVFHHRIKSLLHTVMAQVHASRHGNHGARFTLRPAAHIADLFISLILPVLSFGPGNVIFLYLFLFQCKSPLSGAI